MDASRFDTWTRRRFGIATGGIVATLLGLAAIDQIDAKDNKKKRKRKRRRKKHDQGTTPVATCKALGSLCTVGESTACCTGQACAVPYDLSEGGTTTYCCYPQNGGPCMTDRDCCYPAFCTTPGGICQVNSDRNLKANFGSVDAADMLARVATLPISTWNYTADDPAVRHIGPMAQDFVATFGVGADNRHIHPIDGQGIALAAIQGLAAELARLRAENAALTARIAGLEQSSIDNR